MIRNTNYRDEKTLLTHDTQVQDNFITEMNFGVDYAQAGDMPAALLHLQKSVHIYPYAINLLNLGYFYEVTGDLKQAQKHYYQALNALETSSPTAYVHGTDDQKIYRRLGWVLLHVEEYDAAKRVSTEGLQHFPNDETLWVQLAISEENLHEQPEALTAVQMVKKLSPGEGTDTLYTLIVNKQPIPPPHLPLPQ